MAINILTYALAAASLSQFALAAPTASTEANNVLSVRAANMVSGDHSAHADHPAFALYERWLATDRHAVIFRRNATEVVEKYPNFQGVDCDVSKDNCLLVSRMAFSDETTAEMEWHRERSGQLGRRDWPFGTVQDLKTELHYKTYHYLENEDGDEEFAGFESFHEWDLHCKSILFKSSGGQMMADHKITVIDANNYHGYLYTTITHPHGPLHNEKFETAFSCYLFSNQCCDVTGRYGETLLIDGKPAYWPKASERTCHYGKTKTGSCE